MGIYRKPDKTFCIAFYKHIEGHSKRECKDCKAAYARAWRRTPKGIENSKRIHEKNKTTKMVKAITEIMKKVRSGEMVPANFHECTYCFEVAKAYHHDDYDKPLEVKPVCLSCNKILGSGKNRI